MRYLLIVALTVLCAACGGGSGGNPAENDTTHLPPAAAGPPSASAPMLDSSLMGGPPPAWLETDAGSFWLGYSSYCWGSECADFIPPSCGDATRTPKISVRRDETVTAHLDFEPTELALTVYREVGGAPAARRTLEPTRTPSWQVDGDGVFSLFARVEGRDASYVACIEVG